MSQQNNNNNASVDAKLAEGKEPLPESASESKVEEKQATATAAEEKQQGQPKQGGEELPEEDWLEGKSSEQIRSIHMRQLPKFRSMPNEEVVTYPSEGDPGFYDYKRLPKELNVLLENHEVLVKEMLAATNWNAWPEKNLYAAEDGKDWKVVPFLHTFPATDVENSEWVETNCHQCPKTVELLKKIPGIRTALYSRMSPDSKLTPHTGWADLSNHVIRCHIPLVVEEDSSGVWCLGKVQFHTLQPKPSILVFDDSKIHLGFNLHPKRFRCVLIVDLMRPEWMAKGTAVGGMTTHLVQYIDRFRQEINKAKDPNHAAEPVKW